MIKCRIVWDNLVTDDILEEITEFESLDDADNYAYKASLRSGYSQGNYTTYVWLDGDWVDVCFIDTEFHRVAYDSGYEFSVEAGEWSCYQRLSGHWCYLAGFATEDEAKAYCNAEEYEMEGPAE